MIHITLPDGSQREFQGPVTVAEVAASIGTGLAKAALAGKIDGKVVDTSYQITADSPLSIITAKDADGLEVIRHSTAHLLAYAVKELFPEAQVTIGPVIENGFFYDFAYKRPFTPEDLVAIEKRMAELAAKDEPVVRRVLPRDEAVAYFKGLGEHYKAEIIASIPSNEDVSLYREGNFEDLCRGPHVPSTGKLKFFKLMKVAGAYWRGDHRNEMLQRVYGTAWATKDELQQYLTMLEEAEKRDYALKPMNCPGHIIIFKQGIKSYRDLPLRFGEFGQCHRNEPTGGLHGIMRVRAFTQDDGHIFCTEDQIQSEVVAFTTLLQKVYKDFGFTDIIYKLSTRPEKRIGSEESWDRAENALAEGLRASGCEFEYLPGEGAFYGPKIEYTLKDALGRPWQCGTIQVDPNMPERLDAEFVGEDGARHRPIMLHRAIVGSLERFIGILIEQHAGALPTWLAPVQVSVLNITDAQSDYCREIAAKLQKALPNQGLRVALDLRNEKITYKIREHSMQKLPYILVAGDKEKAAGAVAVRARGNRDLGVMSVDAFIELIANDIATKA